MHKERIGLFGASGYAGVELVALLEHHPQATLAVATSDRSVDAAAALGADCAAVLLATPADVSLALVPRLHAMGCRVVDLSGAFRFRDGGAFTRAYGLAAPPAELLATSAWALPELARAAIARSKIVANPGCYPTAAVLALGPLLRAGVIARDDLVIDALSGVSGAGRSGAAALSFMDLHADARAYKVLSHQHTPEIAEGLAAFAGGPVSVTFTPHLVPVARGILCTSYARLVARATSADLTRVLEDAYRGERFVHVAPSPDEVSLGRVVGTNDCLLGVACEPRAGGRVVVVSAIDNLLKGAAGQAVQNLNLALGWEEAAGLSHLRRLHT